MKSARRIQQKKEEKAIILKFYGNDIKIILNETETAYKLLEVLPVEARVNTWGEEIYFPVPLETGLENGIEIVDIGTVAFWPPGSAVCIFFGITPASETDKPQAASPVTIIGKLADKNDIDYLRTVGSGDSVTLTGVGVERNGKD